MLPLPPPGDARCSYYGPVHALHRPGIATLHIKPCLGNFLMRGLEVIAKAAAAELQVAVHAPDPHHHGLNLRALHVQVINPLDEIDLDCVRLFSQDDYLRMLLLLMLQELPASDLLPAVKAFHVSCLSKPLVERWFCIMLVNWYSAVSTFAFWSLCSAMCFSSSCWTAVFA